MTELDLFAAAIGTADPAARAALLDRECAGDPARRDRLHKLLAAHFADGRLLTDDATGTFGDHAATRDPDATADRPGCDEVAGALIAGKYALVESIGEGGMGAVWRAKQTEPVKRFVAVKLIKAGMDSKTVLARFEAERQALALMDHPNIAKVLDGGLHENRPYFVMELVKGVPITEYCDHHKLTPKARLELFVQACQAIQHAHQKGVIHRDIKPSNVLVALYDDRPVVKVIDFGVAKATGGALTEKTIDTGFGGIVGTPQYMSPEQATFNNLDIDTRSDVYALGVLLYELLAGSPPFSGAELKKKGLMEILRVVREEEPPRPSTKLSTADALPSLSANRGTEPKKLTGLLRNELDWIVMKALEKDRTRRYETANGFAADVQRYLSGEAVQAHPPSRMYRLKKFVRRNRVQVIAASLVLLALVAGVVGTALGLREAQAQRRYAEDQEEIAKGETEKKETARAAEEATRKQFERQALSMQIDMIAADSAEEKDPLTAVRLRIWRYAATAGQVPDHARELRHYLTAMTLLTAQEFCPLWPRRLTDQVQNTFVFPWAEGVAFAQTKTGRVRVCDVLTGATRHELFVPDRHLWFVTVSGDGRRIATLTFERPADATQPQLRFAWQTRYQFWDAATGRLLAETPPPNAGELQSGPRTFTPDGSRFLSVSERLRPTIERLRRPGGADSDRVVCLWDATDGRLITALPGDSPCLSPDGRSFVLRRQNTSPGKEVVEARVYATADGKPVATVADPDEVIRLAEFTPSGRYLFTLTDTRVRWWGTGDWKPAGPPSARRDDSAGMLVDIDMNERLGPKVAHQWPRRWVARDDFAVNCWESDTFWIEKRMPILNRGGTHAMQIVRRGVPTGSDLAGTPWAISDDFVLSNSGRMYAGRDGRVLFPPAGRNYPDELPRMSADGRFVFSTWPATTPVIDAAVGKPLLANVGEKVLYVTAASGRSVLVGGRDLCFPLDFSSTLADYLRDDYPCPTAVPTPAVVIPPDHLLRWVKVVIRGEFDANSEFRKWDERRWEAERRELAALVPHPDYPFPGPVAADPNYWLYREYTEEVARTDRQGVEPTRIIAPLRERLLAVEPTADLYLASVQAHVKAGGDLDAAVRAVGEAERLLGGFCPQGWFYSTGYRQFGPREQGSDPNSTLVGRILTAPNLKPETYAAAVAAANRWESESRWQQGVYGRSAVRALLPALAAYRFGRYDEALHHLAALEFRWTAAAVSVSGYAIPTTVWPLAVTLRAESLRQRPEPGQQWPILDLIVLRSLVLTKLGKSDEARAAWEGVVARQLRGGPLFERVALGRFEQEAMAIFGQPPPKAVK